MILYRKCKICKKLIFLGPSAGSIKNFICIDCQILKDKEIIENATRINKTP